MKLLRTILAGISLVIFFPLFAQDKLFTIEDAVIGQTSTLYPEYLAQLKWVDDSHFSYVTQEGLVVVAASEPDKRELKIKLEDLNNALGKEGLSAMNYILGYDWMDKDNIHFQHDNSFIAYNIKEKTLTMKIQYSDSAENIDPCPARKVIAYTVENNLFIADGSGQPVQVSYEADKDVKNGHVVHRNEFGIEKGTFWSPAGNLLAYYRMDESMVTGYPFVDITARIAELKSTKYPMAGMQSHQVTLGVYNLSTGKTVFMETGEPKEQYLTCVTWSPDEKYVFIGLLNREQNYLKMNQYDAATGKPVRTLFEERHKKYVEPEHPLLFLNTKPDEYIWNSERDGYNHLYLYSLKEGLIRQLTRGDWMVTDVLGTDPEDDYIYIETTAQSPLERHIYKVNIANGKTMRLTKAVGTHSVHLSAGASFLTDAYSSTDVPKVIDLLDNTGKLISNLLTSKNPLMEYKMPEMEIITLKSGDGSADLYGRLIKPLDYDPDKKYPAIIYVYGGPHAQLVSDCWLGGARLWEFYMAQKGYLMLTVDNRGSAFRGLEFENSVFRNLGELEMQDQMAGINYLKGLGYVDEDRIGIHGWSYGGFMTVALKLHYPGIFKVAVAGGPVIDWKYYEVMYGERYMDTPDENPEGYKKNCLLNYVDSLDGRLLIIHGAMDPVVVWQNSLVFVRECVKKNKLLDYFVYPCHEHNVTGYDRVHLMRKVTRYFDDFL